MTSPIAASTAVALISAVRDGDLDPQLALVALRDLHDFHAVGDLIADLQVEYHGSLTLIRPITPLGHEAITHVLDCNHEAMSFGGALVVEPRYVDALLDTLADEFGVTY